MERLGISRREAGQEPNEAIERALLTWSLDSQRDKLEAVRRTK